MICCAWTRSDMLTWLLQQTVTPTEKRKIAFLVACGGQAKGVQTAKADAARRSTAWIPYQQGPDNTIWVMNFNKVKLFDQSDDRVRLVLVKMKQKVKTCKKNKVRSHDKTRIYAIVTNLTNGYGPRQIFRKYHQRQTIELMFRELKNAFFVGKLPSQKMNVNQVYFLMCCIAYNASSYFKRDALPTSHQNASMITVRAIFLQVPAKSTATSKIEFNAKSHRAWFCEAMARKVKRLVSAVSAIQVKC